MASRDPAIAALLDVQEVTLTYATGPVSSATAPAGAFTAVADVSFSVAPGERLVLLGPSGCGKSTLLQAVAGFLPPARGAITVGGRPVTGPGPDRVVVFQEFDQLLPWRTVLGNVSWPLRVARRLGRDAAAEAARPFLAMVGLERFAGAFPHTLSGGMKQRVAIARALALEPAILLMDEPFASLDALTRRRMQDELLAVLAATRTTLLFVTHAIDEAIFLGERIVVLSPGPGRVRRVLDNPAAGARQSPDALALAAAVEVLLAA